VHQGRDAVDVHALVLHKDGSFALHRGSFTNLLDDPSVGAIVNNYLRCYGAKTG